MLGMPNQHIRIRILFAPVPDTTNSSRSLRMRIPVLILDLPALLAGPGNLRWPWIASHSVSSFCVRL